MDLSLSISRTHHAATETHDPAVTENGWILSLLLHSVFIGIGDDSWRSSVAAILGEDVAFTLPSLQCVDLMQRMKLYTKREEVEVTESDTGQHSEKVQQRSSSTELEECPIGQKVRVSHIDTSASYPVSTACFLSFNLLLSDEPGTELHPVQSRLNSLKE